MIFISSFNAVFLNLNGRKGFVGHLAMSGDSFGCHNGGERVCYWHLVDGSQDADKYSAMCSMSPSPQKKKKNLTPKVCTVEIS